MKRVMKELFRLHRPELKDHYDLWVLIKHRFSRPEVPRIREMFLSHLRHLE